jgi:drug/metabolite transporter (DMT)-like permease
MLPFMGIRNASLLVLLGAIWGGSFVLIRLAAPDMGVIAMTSARVFMSALVMAAIVYARNGYGLLFRHARHVFILGLLNTAVPFCLMSWATVELNVNVASILNATVPVWAMLIGIFWIKTKPDALRLLGVIVALAGVVVLVSGKPGFVFSAAFLPTASALASTFLYALSSHYTHRYLPGVDPVILTAGSLMAAAAALFPLGWFFWPDHDVATLSWLCVIALALVATVFAYFIYFRVLHAAGPERAVLVTYLIPVFAGIWGYLFLGQYITAQMALGGLVVIAGTGLASGLFSLGAFKTKGCAA